MFGLKLRKWIAWAFVLVLIAYSVPHFPHDPRLLRGIYRIHQLAAECEKYKQEHGTYPTTLKDIGVGSSSSFAGVYYSGATGVIPYKDGVETDYSSDQNLKRIGYKIYIEYSDGRLLYQKNPYLDRLDFEGWYSFSID